MTDGQTNKIKVQIELLFSCSTLFHGETIPYVQETKGINQMSMICKKIKIKIKTKAHSFFSCQIILCLKFKSVKQKIQ